MRKGWLVLSGFAVGVAVAFLSLRHSPAVESTRGYEHASFAERELERVIAKVDMNAVPLDRAVEDVRKLTRAEIRVEWDELNKIGTDSQSLVTMHGTDVQLGQVLDQLVNQDLGG